jgi:O-antigen/teichoic acid export membrane protein
MLDCERPSLERQLLSNQIWETVAFIAKAAFMLGLTPWMIRTWGAQGYGEFALASSTFVLLSLVDLGIRAKTRLALCSAGERDRAQWPSIVLHSAVTFAIVGVLTIAASSVLTATGAVNALFKISAANRNLFFITTMMSILVMLSGLLLEPLVAVGRIGKLKLATAGGWLAAIPCVALVLATKGPVISAVIVWLGCLLGANLLVLFGNRPTFRASALRPQLEFGRLVATLKEGFWFNICNATWTTKTYGTTLLISAINNPATAGLFFILLRLSEIISGLGAISCDVSLGELAHAKTVSQRRQSFESSYSWAAILCSHFAVILGFITSDFCRIWLRSSWPLPAYAGAIVAALGLSSALNRKAIYVGSGLGAVKLAAKCSLVEAGLFLALMGFLPDSLGLMNRLGLATVAVAALIPIVFEISRRLLVGSIKLWLQPLSSIAPFAATSAAVLLFGALTGRPLVKICATAVSGVILLFNVLYWRKTRLPPFDQLGLTSAIATQGCAVDTTLVVARSAAKATP